MYLFPKLIPLELYKEMVSSSPQMLPRALRGCLRGKNESKAAWATQVSKIRVAGLAISRLSRVFRNWEWSRNSLREIILGIRSLWVVIYLSLHPLLITTVFKISLNSSSYKWNDTWMPNNRFTIWLRKLLHRDWLTVSQANDFRFWSFFSHITAQMNFSNNNFKIFLEQQIQFLHAFMFKRYSYTIHAFFPFLF